MASFIDDRYKIHIYLDTNILVDYVERRNKLLNESLDILSNIPFVILRSSHYVEFEFVEVRKRNEFYRCVKGLLPDAGTNLGFAKEWVLDEVSYEAHKDAIAKKVKEDLAEIKNRLSIDFDDHVLHEKLIEPTMDICLSTKISREDSMVMVSCMYPKPSPSDLLKFGVILSNDKQYKEAFDGEKNTIEKILNSNGISIPSFLSIKQLQKEGGGVINLNVNTKVDIKNLWTYIIKQLIKEKHHDDYVGETIVPMKDLTNCIAICKRDSDFTIRDSIGLIIVPIDLSRTISIEKNKNYWNNGKEIKELPFTNPDDLEYNLKVSCSETEMNIICQKGNLVFYDDL